MPIVPGEKRKKRQPQPEFTPSATPEFGVSKSIKPKRQAVSVSVEDELPDTPEVPLFGSKFETDFQPIDRVDTPLGETLETSFDAASDRTSLSIRNGLVDRYQGYIDEIEKVTGQRPFNPMYEPGRGRKEIIERRERGEDVDGLSHQNAAFQRFHRRVAELQKEFPELALRSHDDIVGQVRADRQAVIERRAKAEAGETGFVSGGAAFVGQAGGALLDPVNIATLPLGAPWASGVLRVIATETAIGLASETAVQTAFQTSRSQINERPDAGEAIGDILAVGATAGAIGGVVRGAAKGVELLRQRRANLEAAENIPQPDRSLDVDSAIAVERRALDIDERNPYGHDVAGTAAHTERYAAAEQAVASGHATPRPDIGEGVPALSQADTATIRELAELAREPEALATRVEQLREISQDVVEQHDTLAEFVERLGGIASRDEAVARLGITEEGLPPGILNRKGMALQEVAEAAEQQGFFPKGKKVTADDVAAALESERQGQPVRRLRRGRPFTDERIASERQASVLQRLGIDVNDLQPSEVAARVRTMAQGIEQQQVLRDAGSDPRPDAEGAARSEARAEEAQTSTAAEREVELDEIREQQVRDAFAGRENEKIMIEDEDGVIRPITVRDLFETAEREADELDALRLCIAGGSRRTA